MNNPTQDDAAGQFDVIVIGAGIAGASVAAHLASEQRVLLLEMESQPGYHTTGRSAALFTETYGPPPIRALTRASADLYDNPPDGFTDVPLLTPRGAMLIARADQAEALDQAIEEASAASPVRRLSPDEARARVPLLRADYLVGAMAEAGARDIDVNALHQGYLRQFRAGGGELLNRAGVTALHKQGKHWRVTTGRGEFTAPVVVNAAGAWADKVGELAGLPPIGLVPKRRTALIVACPTPFASGEQASDQWPAVIDVSEQFYMKPDAGRLLISPADETPSEPCDAQPDEMDVAICVDRIQAAFDLPVQRIENRWAGLRSFVADKCPVCGFDSNADGFFWLAGQGGYGIQSAPALSRVAAAMVMRRDVPADITAHGFDAADLSPHRSALQRG